MPIPTLNKLPPNPSFSDISIKINQLVGELTQLLLNLDTLNIIELNAEVITALSITADKLAVGSVTADKISVNELSAISADLGTITAGLIQGIQIYGSYIATRSGGLYPRAEMSNTQDLFGVYLGATQFIQMAAIAGFLYMKFRNGSSEIDFNSVSSGISIQGLGNLTIALPLGVVDFNASAVRVPSWSTFYNNSTSQSLQDALNSINSNISSLFGLYANLDARVTALEGA